jgi:hypothetical protein
MKTLKAVLIVLVCLGMLIMAAVACNYLTEMMTEIGVMW